MKEKIAASFAKNKDVILRRTLVIGGTIAGIAIAAVVLSKTSDAGADALELENDSTPTDINN